MEDVMKKLDKEYDKDEVFLKEENQLDRVEPATKALQDMGTYWKKIHEKLLNKDKICYLCKKEIKNDEKVSIVEVPHNKIDKGIIGFACVCNNCQ